MKIGIVTTWFERGAGIVSRQIADSFIECGHSVEIYARGEKYAIGDAIWDRENVHWGKRVHWPGSGKIDKLDFTGWIEKNSLDVIIFNEQRWWQPIAWAKELGVKCGSYIDYYTRRSIYNFEIFDFLICNTQRHFSAFAWHHSALYIPWGTDVRAFAPRPKTDKVFTFFHSCGWDENRKGTDLVVDAFTRIADQINAKLIIHSQVEISDLPQRDDVKVIRDTIPIPGLFHLGDVYVYPSRLEGIGLTICEALSCGLPVITTDERPMSEFVKHEHNGWLVPVTKRYNRSDGYFWPMAEVSADDLAEAMLRAYHCQTEHLELLKRNARETAEKERNWSKNCKILPELVEASTYRPITHSQKLALWNFDHSGVRGKIDYLLDVPVAKNIVARIVKQRRQHRQPHLYADTK